MSNRVTMAQAMQMPVTEVANLPIGILHLLMEDVAEAKAAAKKADDHLFAALHLRFSAQMHENRKANGTDTGRARLDAEDYVVMSDLPKRVSWDADGLRQVARQLEATGEPVSDYIQVRMDVPEKSYLGWPQSLKKMFDPHRTVGVGKETFKIEKKDAA